ncbi:unnamed protein product [Sphagnum jensenii]
MGLDHKQVMSSMSFAASRIRNSTTGSGRIMQSRFQTIILAALFVLQCCIYVRLTWAQPGFLSLDCGSTSATAYNDQNNITWVPDTGYIFTGEVYQKVQYQQSFISEPAWASMRYFPENRTKSCYVLPALPFQTYLIRATFYYSTFLPSPPKIIVEVEAELACVVDFPSILPTADPVLQCEVILSATTDTFYVCLAPYSPTDVPFISALELRALDTTSMYTDVQNAYLYDSKRETLGTSLSETIIRYPNDKYDRQWFSRDVLQGAVDPNASIINTTNAVVVSTASDVDMVPELAMQTAYEWAPGTGFNFTFASFESDITVRNYYVALYFAEIDPRAANKNESRIFDLFLNGQLAVPNISVAALAGGMYSTLEISVKNVTFSDTGTIQLIPHVNSTLGAILNAYEIYLLAEPVPLRTAAADAFAIENIKKALNLTTWTGDPCVYTPYNWIACTSNSTNRNEIPPNILAVELTNYNLTGTIPDALSNLTMLTTLWLDDNSLQGPIPESLSALTNLVSLRLSNNELTGSIPTWLESLNLQELILSNNNFSGMIPPGLLKKANLSFQYSGNPYLCISTTTCSAHFSPSPSPTIAPPPPNPSPNHTAAIVGAIVGGLVVAIAATLVLVYYFCCCKTKNNNHSEGEMAIAEMQSPGPEKPYGTVAQEYSFVEVMSATNNFSKVLGEGSFGVVYYGKLPNGQEVAVKRLSTTSLQGAKEFFTEVDLLTKVHHKNLVSLVGFCNTEKEQILIYEYMSNGSVCESLYGTPKAYNNPINWKTRLNIALNAAQGLEYLHTGCKHPIIHRDIKPSNILLSSKMVAKVADFGLSKMNVNEGVSYVSTRVKGTAGYMDPEYYTSEQLTTKSDVFSFGVVLLELICGRKSIDVELPPSKRQLTNWVRSHLQAGVIHPIVDQALGNQFNVESMWKVAEIAMRSVEPYGAHRPTMMQVVADLREAMEIEENVNPSNLANPTHQTISRTLLGGNFTSHESLDHMVGDNSLTPSGSKSGRNGRLPRTSPSTGHLSCSERPPSNARTTLSASTLTTPAVSPISGFLSLDCGSTSATAYNDQNNITWVPDTGYIFTGEVYQKVQYQQNSNSEPAWTSMRYFPENRTKSCYVLPALPFQTYLIRATFYYSTFLSSPPKIIVEVEAELACVVDFPSILPNAYPVLQCEVILSATTDTFYVCLAPYSPTDVPFISALELRALDTTSMYTDVQNAYLYYSKRETLGTSFSELMIRYPNDKYDRQWFSRDVFQGAVDPNASIINTTNAVVVSTASDVDMVPELAMQTAYEWAPGTGFNFTFASFESDITVRNYYVALYFAEIDPRAANKNESRIFDLFLNGQLAVPNISVAALAGGMYSTLEISVKNVTFSSTGTIQLIPHVNSTLGAILNAYEIYLLTEPVPLRTAAADAFAIENIKKALNLATWTGDPCVYTPYNWIACTSNSTNRNEIPPNIVSVELTNYNLTGTIPDSLSNLTMLTTLWLDDNSLQGPIPESLSALTNLVSLILSNNNFSGMIPPGLLKKANLSFQYSGNPYLCISTTTCSPHFPPSPSPTIAPSSNPSPNHIAAIVGAIVGGLVVAIATTLVLVYYFCCCKTTNNNHSEGEMAIVEMQSPGPQKPYGTDGHQVGGPQVAQEYSFVEVMSATNNFSKVLGEGSFGVVYYGKLPNGQEVAVKRLSTTSLQGAKEFFNKVDLLTKVHHKNLVSLVGFCNTEKEQILIHEYMSNGSVCESLYGTPKAYNNPLNWKTRLNIALNAAQGLEYLHTGCKHPIIHRDIKPSNILLSSKMVAKVADFGLSKMNVNEGASYVSTQIKGTAGYMDPEYYTNEQLTTKSDVFSFGVVLLELICGRKSIDVELPPSKRQLTNWVRSHLQAGVIHPIVDQALGNQFNVESMWKVAEIAMRSVEPYGAHRPTMMQVVADLREAMEIEENVNPSNLANPTHQTISRTLLGGNFTSHESLDHMVGDNSLTPSGASKVDIDSGPHAR